MMQTPVKLGLAPDAVISAYCALRQVDEAVLLHDRTQTRAITERRHELMWLLHNLTVSPHDVIARLFGRHSSTVWEAVSNVCDRMASDDVFRRRLRDLREQIVQLVASPPALTVDPRASAARVVAAVSVLRDQQLTDTEARQAALSILSSMMEAPGA